MSRNEVTVEEPHSDETAELSPEEERVLRMRAGVGLSGGARLESKLENVAPEHHDKVAAQLDAIQRETMQALEDRAEATDKKDKIVLRLLKKEQE